MAGRGIERDLASEANTQVSAEEPIRLSAGKLSPNLAEGIEASPMSREEVARIQDLFGETSPSLARTPLGTVQARETRSFSVNADGLRKLAAAAVLAIGVSHGSEAQAKTQTVSRPQTIEAQSLRKLEQHDEAMAERAKLTAITHGARGEHQVVASPATPQNAPVPSNNAGIAAVVALGLAGTLAYRARQREFEKDGSGIRQALEKANVSERPVHAEDLSSVLSLRDGAHALPQGLKDGREATALLNRVGIPALWLKPEEGPGQIQLLRGDELGPRVSMAHGGEGWKEAFTAQSEATKRLVDGLPLRERAGLIVQALGEEASAVTATTLRKAADVVDRMGIRKEQA